MTKQIKSKKRVAKFGEVYTNEREVNAMLDLVKEESFRIDSRFLEPACGNGNFLIKILERKLNTVLETYKDQWQYEELAFTVISSIYAIDILEDNVNESRLRLYHYFKEQYTSIFKETYKEEFCGVILFVLEQNIVHGDGLTAMRVTKQDEKERPIVFAQWVITDGIVFRRDFRLLDMLNNESPSPYKLYAPIHYLKVGKTDE